MIKLYHGDCLIEHENIEDESVDLIMIDPPYGTVKGLELPHSLWERVGVEWDTTIDTKELFEIAERILKNRGRMIIFSQQPYTTELIKNANTNLSFSYNMIWIKNEFANFFLSGVAPVSYYEDIVMFRKTVPLYDYEGKHPLRSYFTDVKEFIGLSLGKINDILGHRRAEHSFYLTSTQFVIPTQETYNELIETFNIDQMDGFKPFDKLKETDDIFKAENIEPPSTFNLPEGKNSKPNVFYYDRERDRYHPTQKPILLLEDLIKTFSNEGDLVVDLTMGSGSTGVACKNTGRRFIGIEMDEGYYNTAKERIEKTNTLGEWIL